MKSIGDLLNHDKLGIIAFRFDSNLRELEVDFPAAYILLNNTGKFYVGSTSRIKSRINQHRSYLRAGGHVNKNLQEMYNRTKEDRLLFHIFPCANVEEARGIEKSFLNAHYSSIDCTNVNLTDKELHTERVDKLRRWNKSPEARAMKSIVSKKLWKDPVFRNRIIEKIGEGITVDGNRYLSVREASRQTGYAVSVLRKNMISGSVDTSKIKPLRRKILADGIEYNSIKEAADAYGIRDNTMHYRVNSTDPKWDAFKYC